MADLMERIEELARLEAAATPGPWASEDCSTPNCWCKWIDAPPGGDGEKVGVCTSGSLFAADSDFIAAARNTVPDLIAAYRAALTALEASHRELDALRFAIADNCCLLLGSHERMQEFKANPEAAWDAVIAERDALAAKLAAAMQFVDPPSEWPDYEDAPESVRRRIEAAAMLHGVNPDFVQPAQQESE